jgi:hypothetical protein
MDNSMFSADYADGYPGSTETPFHNDTLHDLYYVRTGTESQQLPVPFLANYDITGVRYVVPIQSLF